MDKQQSCAWCVCDEASHGEGGLCPVDGVTSQYFTARPLAVTTTHCWKGHREWLEETGQAYTDAWAATWDCDGTCMLPDGHDGPHEFVPDAEIQVAFSP